eukprot:684183_1
MVEIDTLYTVIPSIWFIYGSLWFIMDPYGFIFCLSWFTFSRQYRMVVYCVSISTNIAWNRLKPTAYGAEWHSLSYSVHSASFYPFLFILVLFPKYDQNMTVLFILSLLSKCHFTTSLRKTA